VACATVVAVHRSAGHSFSKFAEDAVMLVEGWGVEGDAHSGRTVKHRSRVARDPSQPNLRQVHLLHSELFADLAAAGFTVAPGELGENVTTRGIDLLGLSAGTRLRVGAAVVEVTGLRNPCSQIDRFQQGLTAAVLGRDAQGGLVRKAGVMAVVVETGPVRTGDPIAIESVPLSYAPLVPV
jgi:MOSC domain-containing protein YiiM